MKGKYIQYREQCDKKKSLSLYDTFKEILKQALVDAGKVHDSSMPAGAGKKKKTQLEGALPSTSPKYMFQKPPFKGLYMNFDEHGFPSHDSNGQLLTKSMSKKLNKLYKRQVKRHEKFLKNPDAFKDELDLVNKMVKEKVRLIKPNTIVEETTADTVMLQEDNQSQKSLVVDENVLPIQLVCGTFGNRQGLKLNAECGPFSHVVEF